MKTYYNEESRKECLQWFIDNMDRMDPAKKSILFVAVEDNGTCHFRVTEPMRCIHNAYPDKFNIVLTRDPQPEMVEKFDMIYMHSTDRRQVRLLIQSDKLKRDMVFVFDHDDWIHLHKSHPSYELWYSSQQDIIGEMLARSVDCVITTQEQLRDKFSKLNSNTMVIRNAFDWSLPQWNVEQDYLQAKNAEGKLVIGWCGVPTHLGDIYKMSKFLKVIHDRYPHTHFVIAGIAADVNFIKIVKDPETGEDKHIKIDTPEHFKYKNMVAKCFKDFAPDRVEMLPIVDTSEYSKYYAMFNISLAYVEDNFFNKCKSEIKVVESLKYGCVPVFSYIGGYKEFFDNLREKHWDLAVPADNPETWVRKLTKIIENYGHYAEIAQGLKAYVEREYDIKHAVKARVDLFEDLLKMEV